MGPARAAGRRSPGAAGRAWRPRTALTRKSCWPSVAEYLRDLRSRAPAEDTFPLAVAANACRVVARELPPDDPAPRERAARLAASLRAGEHDDALDDLVDPLRAEVRAKLEVANPRWL